MTYPHELAYCEQAKTLTSKVLSGAENAMAIAPLSLALGIKRPHIEIELAHVDASIFDDMFYKCPIYQWGACAQAAMSMRGDEL